MRRAPKIQPRVQLALWLALLFGCAAGISDEEQDLGSTAQEAEVEASSLRELARQQEPPDSDNAVDADDATASEFARLLQARLDTSQPARPADGGASHPPVDDEVVSELTATLDRSIELAQLLLEQDAGAPAGDEAQRAHTDAGSPSHE